MRLVFELAEKRVSKHDLQRLQIAEAIRATGVNIPEGSGRRSDTSQELVTLRCFGGRVGGGNRE